MIDPLDRSAVLALLVRRDEALFGRRDQQKVLDEAKRQLEDFDKRLKGYTEALKAFGFDINVDETLKSIRKDYGREIREALIERGTYPADWLKPPESAPGPEPKSEQTIADLIMDRLVAAGAEGSKAAPIRQWIEETKGTEIHEKTVGMSLYRLLKKGRVRRDGHTWFAVPQPAEKVNPGVSAPGSD